MAEVRVPLDLEDELTTYDSPDTTYTDVGVEDDLVSYKINKANEKIFFQGTLPDLIEANETSIETNTTTISSNSDNISALDSTLSGSVVAVSESTSYEITEETFRITLDTSTVSEESQVITFSKGTSATRLNIVQVYNGSEESVEVSDGTNSYDLSSDSYASFFFQGDDLEQEVTGSDSSGEKEIGDIFFTAVPYELTGSKWCDYSTISQTTYTDLFTKIGHLFAKDSTDQASAETAGTFHLPDAQFLFARGGRTWSLTEASFSTSTYEITLEGHGFATDGTDDGRAVKLQRWAGQDPTLPTATAFTEYNQSYIAVIDADTFYLYTTESDATTNDGSTNLLSWSDAGSGTFMLSSIGCYQDSAVQRITGSLYDVGTGNTDTLSDGAFSQTEELSSDRTTGTGVRANGIFDSGDSLTDNTSDTETRPSYVSLGMQIKCIGSDSSGTAIDTLTYDSGWTVNSDWTNATLLISHSLDANLDEFIMKFIMSETGSTDDATSFDLSVGYNNAGIFSSQVDSNSFNIITGANGVRIMSSLGVVTTISTSQYYWKVVMYKPSLIATASTNTLVSVTEDSTIAIETTEKTIEVADTVEEEITITLTEDSGVNATNCIWIKNKGSESINVVYSTYSFRVDSGQKVKFYIDDSTLVWGSTSWEEVWLDLTNTEDVGYQDQNIGGLNSDDKLEFLIYYTSGTNYRVCEMIVYDPDVIAHSSQAGASSSTYSVVVADPDEGDNGEFSCPVTGNIRRIRRWHDGE